MDFPKNFIRAGREYCTLEKYVPAPLFRHTFGIEEKPLKSAVLRITGLGFYELHINGCDITKGFLAPYRSNLDHYVYYDDYEVKDKLIGGKNVIAVILGNGFQNALGGYVWDFDKAAWRGAPQFAFLLELEFEDGEKKTITSGGDTKTASSPIIFDDTHFGEYYDARLELPGWDTPSFGDGDWRFAEPAPVPRGEARLCAVEPIVLREKFSPIGVSPYKEGYIYEFPVNAAGFCRLRIKNTRPGQKITLVHFESMIDGEPDLKGIRFEVERDRYQEDIYYCAGREYEEHIPRFTYHGFKFVYVTGIDENQATPDLLEFEVISSDIKQIGEFSCDDAVANAVQKITLRADISNFHYFPTDCPQREKNGWTGDASLSAEQLLMNFSAENSFREWMRNIYKAINEKGQLPGIVPTSGWGYHWGNGPAWDSVLVNIPYYTYLYRGDSSILEELAVPLMRYLTYLYSQLDKNDLAEIGLGDYLQPSLWADDYETPLIVTCSIYTADIAAKAAFIYDVLGLNEHKQYAEALAHRVRNAVRRNLIDLEKMSVRCGTQTAQAMAIYYGMFDEKEKAGAARELVRLVNEAGGHFKTGILGGRAIYRALAENGYADLAYNMIVRKDYPSYGNWIERGATTLWEQFWEDDHIMTGSKNHHMWGDVSAWFYTYPGGIRINPTGRDVSNVNIAPVFLEKLNRVTASHKLPLGRVEVNWNRTGETIDLRVAVPQTVHGSIILPAGYAFENGKTKTPLESGEYRLVGKR
ncbi:MAG: family 78 glycoside hydrolase catalytic domain [Clostridia bacterium]|nr:family 78 glycoside hydrolase catalytic domain [Clostridia bacterium]